MTDVSGFNETLGFSGFLVVTKYIGSMVVYNITKRILHRDSIPYIVLGFSYTTLLPSQTPMFYWLLVNMTITIHILL